MSKNCTQGYCKLLSTFTFNSQATLSWPPGGLCPGPVAIPPALPQRRVTSWGHPPLQQTPPPHPSETLRPLSLHINASSQLEKSKFTLATTSNTLKKKSFMFLKVLKEVGGRQSSGQPPPPGLGPEGSPPSRVLMFQLPQKRLKIKAQLLFKQSQTKKAPEDLHNT